MIRKRYPSAQGCDGAEVPYIRDLMQQDHPAYLSAFGSQKKKNKHLNEPRYWEGVPDLQFLAGSKS
jgi:hypothetical protein